jgi:hypothetical protein
LMPSAGQEFQFQPWHWRANRTRSRSSHYHLLSRRLPAAAKVRRC